MSLVLCGKLYFLMSLKHWLFLILFECPLVLPLSASFKNTRSCLSIFSLRFTILYIVIKSPLSLLACKVCVCVCLFTSLCGWLCVGFSVIFLHSLRQKLSKEWVCKRLDYLHRAAPLNLYIYLEILYTVSSAEIALYRGGKNLTPRYNLFINGVVSIDFCITSLHSLRISQCVLFQHCSLATDWLGSRLPGFQDSILDCRRCDSPQTVHPECFPIGIPQNDPFFPPVNISSGQPFCVPLRRSMPGQLTLGMYHFLCILLPSMDLCM